MKILINDILQTKDIDDPLKTPSLADTSLITSFTIVFDNESETVDCIGIGNTDATEIVFNGETIVLSTTENQKNGLYLLSTGKIIESDFYLLTEASEELLTETGENIIVENLTVTFSHNGTYIGRVAVGKYRDLYPSPAREPGFYTTQKPRVTASGNVVEGAGGVSGKELNLDFRYKFTLDIFNDIESAFSTQIAKGFPFFLYFDKETQWISWLRMYGQDTNRMLFQSSVNRFLYSKRMKLIERF
ncbi:hypothetical protein KA005_22370 [bacterium]|nr:hypothetical protein [bacterium]